MVTSELLFIVLFQFLSLKFFNISALKIILVIHTSHEGRQFVGLLKWAWRPDPAMYWLSNFGQAIGIFLSQVPQLEKGTWGQRGARGM